MPLTQNTFVDVQFQQRDVAGKTWGRVDGRVAIGYDEI